MKVSQLLNFGMLKFIRFIENTFMINTDNNEKNYQILRFGVENSIWQADFYKVFLEEFGIDSKRKVDEDCIQTMLKVPIRILKRKEINILLTVMIFRRIFDELHKNSTWEVGKRGLSFFRIPLKKGVHSQKTYQVLKVLIFWKFYFLGEIW